MKRTKITLEIFKVEVPDKQNPEVTKTYHFTTADRAVTYDAQQYVPISMFDQEKWLKGENDGQKEEKESTQGS